MAVQLGLCDLVGNPEDRFSRVVANILMVAHTLKLQRQTKERSRLLRNCFDCFNLYMTNGFSHHYHLGESTSVLRGIIGCDF